MRVSINVKINPNVTHSVLLRAMSATMEDVKDRVITDQVMPFDSGTMQNKSTFTKVYESGKTITGLLITDTPYARYQFYGISRFSHNPLNYQTGHNASARSHWLDPYMDPEFLSGLYQQHLAAAKG